MINLLLHVLGLIVSIIVVEIPPYCLVVNIYNIKNLSLYGKNRLLNPVINFTAIGVIIIYRAYFCKSLQGIYLNIFDGFIFVLFVLSVLCIIIDSVGDINDEYGMTRNDYVLRVALNLFFLVTAYGLIYWFIFCISPTSYELAGVNIDSLIKQLWQFWFYSFRVAITYGDGTIVAIGIPSQIVQVTEVIIFYFILAKNIEGVFRDWKQRDSI